MAVADAIPKYEKRTRAGNPVEYEVLGKRYRVLAESKGYQERGIASWYGTKFHGRKTSNGEVYNMYAMTAAHKTLPIPSYVRVTNLKNQRSVVLRVNDRGPFHENRIIDLSYTAAVKLGIQKTGTGFVEVTALEFDGAKKSTLVFDNVKQLAQPLTSTVQQHTGAIYLQIGAFISAVNARQLQDKLFSGQIAKSRIQVVKNQQADLYKVQVGPLDSRQQVAEFNKKLALLGFAQAQLVIEK
ncbi:MAG: septal ring lytic transglycosylase RlpA family protein [Methylococcales bacterium]|nr:septal ring lytic transglycosylase RlpA family protein [Methylococcales bacterium]